VSDRLQDRLQGWNSHGDIQQMSSKEEEIEVAQDWKAKIPQAVQESLQNSLRLVNGYTCNGWFETNIYIVGNGDSGFPNLITPVNSRQAEMILTKLHIKYIKSWKKLYNLYYEWIHLLGHNSSIQVLLFNTEARLFHAQ